MSSLLRYSLAPLAYLVLSVLAACLLGYAMLGLIGDRLPLDKLIPKLTQLLLILGLFSLKRRLNLSWRDFGFAPPARFFRQLSRGLALAFITLGPVLLCLYLIGVQEYDAGRVWTPDKLAGKIGLGLLLSLLIAFFEEILFRGLLLASLLRRLPGPAAVTLSALYFALLHFLKSASKIPYSEITPFTPLQLAGEAFGNWLNPQILDALPALFAVGLLLALLRWRYPASLGVCIGCHCGWVWQIKLCKDLWNLNPHSDYLYLVSQYYDGITGPFVAVWLILASAALFNLTRRANPNA